jgi:2'-5' RNA ligase
MTEAPISGFLGLVIEPDAATVASAYVLAASLLPPDAEQVLAPDARPHVTLAQCPVRDAPRARLRALVARLDTRLVGHAFPLKRVVPFTGGFLFWCVDAEAPARALLQAAHEEALTLGDGVLDPERNAAVVDATARASENDAQLVNNARRFGYAFVGDRYLPHITLGFDPKTVRAFEPRDHPHGMTVERIVLARLGRLGRIEDVVAL